MGANRLTCMEQNDSGDCKNTNLELLGLFVQTAVMI